MMRIKLQIASLLVTMPASMVSLEVDQMHSPPVIDTRSIPSLALHGAGDCLKTHHCFHSPCANQIINEIYRNTEL